MNSTELKNSNDVAAPHHLHEPALQHISKTFGNGIT
jgi:hypothetical protein